MKSLVSNVRGALGVGVPPGPPTDQTPGPPETMLQGAEQLGGVPVPVLVPATTTWQVDAVQVIGLPPLFFTESEMTTGDASKAGPALKKAPTITMLVLAVALLTRLNTEALTIPPTPRTAAIMMNRSILWEIAIR